VEYFVQMITACLGSVGFAILFNIRREKLFLASLGGLLCWGVYLLAGTVVAQEVPRCFASAVVVTIYAEILARKVKCPATVFLVTGMVPLIPGSALYYTMNYALNEQWDLFMKKAFYTLELALALALGIIAVTTAARLITLLIRYGKKQACRHFHHSI